MDGTELRRREFLQRTAMAAGLAAGMATVLSPDLLVAEAARASAAHGCRRRATCRSTPSSS
jgi:hypothetical protein